MKKSLFMMGVAIAALSSCTQNEVLDIAESNTIQFGKSYIGKPTRATIIDKVDNLDNFYVYAFTNPTDWSTSPVTSLFTNEKVYKGPNGWGYDNIKEYTPDNVYSFAAYSDGGAAGVDGKLADNTDGEGENGVTFTAPDASGNTAKLEIKNYETNGKDKDLLVAIFQGELSDDNQEVSFAFKHALSQIKFNIHNPLGNNPIEIENFSVEGFKDKATLTYSEPAGEANIAWNTISGEKTINALEKDKAVTNDPAYGTYTIIPQTVDNVLSGEGESAVKGLEVNITATLYKADGTVLKKSQNFKAELTNLPTFEPGYIYNFNATLNMGYIYFDNIEVKEWVPSTPDTEMTPEVQP